MAKVLFIPDSGAGGVSSLGGAAADRRIGMMITCKGNTCKDEQFTINSRDSVQVLNIPTISMYIHMHAAFACASKLK